MDLSIAFTKKLSFIGIYCIQNFQNLLYLSLAINFFRCLDNASPAFETGRYMEDIYLYTLQLDEEQIRLGLLRVVHYFYVYDSTVVFAF